MTYDGAAIVFPGMGPLRYAEAARFLMFNPAARRLVAVADETLGYRLLDRWRDTEGDYSAYAQAAFLVTCLALAEWVAETHDVTPSVIAGASFGGKAAAAYAGAISAPDAIRMTAGIARCEEEYFRREHRDVVTVSFARTPRERLDEILADLTADGGWHDFSCYVDDDLHMVSMSAQRLDWFHARVRQAGGLPLYVTDPPMHSAAFGPLREIVEREVFAGVRFADPDLPVLADQDGSLRRTAAGVRDMLLDGLVMPVRWPRVVTALRDAGVGRVYVAGPDSLFGRVRRTTDNFAVVTANPRLAMTPRRRPLPV
ncbi:Acyl carrier protein malonyltransferase [Actinoplanes sp. SE50]|uniref:ACP malonyltransferase n=1 Tax=unclassified Actinoplanes TaxID=2626549 RepID=UPI00023EC175|nr:Acyl carrier protein malonyltransferase [Actinoplanes sp. SE50/110]ATO85365.1 Acyl carrier protein malonyltransferase [Actinoplanes sp. SE50]SLM02777.1 ACP malonyltransferase [Actinoplanes sp. SE50/110]